MNFLLAIFWFFAAKILAHPFVVSYLIERAKRTPYQHILSPDRTQTYMERYWLFNPYPTQAERDAIKASGAKPKWRFPISVRLHCIRTPDIDRHLHDYPWNARTIILRGSYVESRKQLVRDLPKEWGCFEDVWYKRLAGDTARILFESYHRIVNIHPAPGEDGVWTLFITGKFRGDWGYDVDGIKIPHHEYNKGNALQ